MVHSLPSMPGVLCSILSIRRNEKSRCEFPEDEIFFMVHLYLPVPNNYLPSSVSQYEFAKLD